MDMMKSTMGNILLYFTTWMKWIQAIIQSMLSISHVSSMLSVMFDIHIDGCDCFFLKISACVMVANWYSTLF